MAQTDYYFTPVESGEWVTPIRRGYLMRCCDCGLIHSLDFRTIPNDRGSGRLIQMRGFRVWGEPLREPDYILDMGWS